jgi:hypothetical protein
VVRQVEIAFADPRRTYTKAFERYALELSRHMTILDVARHLGVSWNIVKHIQKRDLTRRYPRPKLKHVCQIAIDEISVAEGWPTRWRRTERACSPSTISLSSTGPLEGTNNKIKTKKRQAYGFRDHEFFKLRILAVHQTKYI